MDREELEESLGRMLATYIVGSSFANPEAGITPRYVAQQMLRAAEREIRADERELCAQVATSEAEMLSEFKKNTSDGSLARSIMTANKEVASRIAAAIRAAGEREEG